MTKAKRFAILALVMLMSLGTLLVGCGAPKTKTTANATPGTNEGKDGKTIELKLGDVFPPGEPLNKVAEKVAQRVKERTNGRVTIKVFPASQLGSDRDRMEQVRAGAPIISLIVPGYLGEWVPDYGVFDGPFLVDGYADYQKILASDWYKQMELKLNGFNMQVLSFNWYFGERDMISNKPTRNPGEMKGLKVRAAPSPMWTETLSAMGGSPTPLEWSEVYTGLSQGVIDAAEAPLSTIYGSKLNESAKTITMTGHFKSLLGFGMSKQVFDSLPKDVQQILMEEMKKGGEELSKETEASVSDWRKKLEEKGVKFVDDVDFKAFKQSTQKVYNAFPKWTPGLYDKIQEIIKK